MGSFLGARSPRIERSADPRGRARLTWGSGASVTLTATLDRGVWFDLETPAVPRGKGAFLLDARPDGTRLTWVLRFQVGLDPIRRWRLRSLARSLGERMETALDRFAHEPLRTGDEAPRRASSR